jgi:hypothetical protein
MSKVTTTSTRVDAGGVMKLWGTHYTISWLQAVDHPFDWLRYISASVQATRPSLFLRVPDTTQPSLTLLAILEQWRKCRYHKRARFGLCQPVRGQFGGTEEEEIHCPRQSLLDIVSWMVSKPDFVVRRV